MLKVAERLDRGAFVGLLGDRTLGEEPVHAVSILGERAYLPTGPMRAAAILRRSVIFMVGLYRGGNHYHVVFEPVADFSASSLKTRAVTPCAACAIRTVCRRCCDKCCSSDPYNWFNFFDFWQNSQALARARSATAL